MQVAIWFIVAIGSYLLAGVNLSIILSQLIYKKDIRTLGSGNPGFTNFKRNFGSKYAWFVFAFDILKSVLPCLLSGLAFNAIFEDWQLGVGFAGCFAMLGHAFPIYYRFKGGKGFLVCLGAVWMLDWRAGLIATGLLVVLLLTVKFMSLSTMCALAAAAISLYFFGCDLPAAIMYSCCVVFMIIRHKENIKRLFAGTESKFSLGGKKDTKPSIDKYVELLESVLSRAKEEQQSILDGNPSNWDLSQIQNVVIPEINELLSHAQNGEVFFKYGPKQRMLESTHLLTDSMEHIGTTPLGNSISKLQEYYNAY